MQSDDPFDQVRAALHACDVDDKLARVAALAAEHSAWAWTGSGHPPASDDVHAGRPDRPVLVPPSELRSRSSATPEGRAALLHAIAHIEFNAINLALDAAWRFRGLPDAYYRDWTGVAAEEALHFRLLRDHLRTLGYRYGDFPAHDGLWEMAIKTSYDPLVRMALVPRVLEARGLDATPGILRKLEAAGDRAAVGILQVILRDEVVHVAIGTRWFEHFCSQRGLMPEPTFCRLLTEMDAPRPVLPMNVGARREAGFAEAELDALEALGRRRTRS